MTTTPDNPINEKMDRLLDEALAPPTPPADLPDRIIAETTPMLRRLEPAVIGRIGFPYWRVAAAAVVLLAGIGAAIVMSLNPSTPQQATPQPTPTADAIDWTQLEQFAQADQNAAPTNIDQQIDLLMLQVELASMQMEWSTGQETFDDALIQYELEQLAGDDVLLF